ncbi:MAG: hypothetical protein FIA96_03850 [Betaproteobacteria bacterium]|nr:hypothetical protein [Betaproteobacteria bacterium]
MFTTLITKAVPLPRCSLLALMMCALMFTGCATNNIQSLRADQASANVIGETQAGANTQGSSEAAYPNAGSCAAVGAALGVAAGIAMTIPVCTNFITSAACPQYAVLMVGGLGLIGYVVGEKICENKGDGS